MLSETNMRFFACSLKLRYLHGCQGIAIRVPAYKFVLNLFFVFFTITKTRPGSHNYSTKFKNLDLKQIVY